MYDLVVSGGQIVTPEGVFTGDVLVRDGKIAAVTCGESGAPARQSIQAAGRFVFPGAIDVHAHLNDPGFTWRETFGHATRAAAAGGVTTIVDMPLQNEPALTTVELFDRKNSIVGPQAAVDFAFWGGLTENNLADLEGLHAKGAPAFKVFVGPVSPDYQTLNMGVIRQAMGIVKRFDGLIGFHAEDYSIIKRGEKLAIEAGKTGRRDFLDSRPVVAELVAVASLIELSKESGVRIHICHVSHPDVAEMISQSQKEGVRITAETCSHYLVFTEGDLLEKGTLFKCAPPLRTKEARERLWRYVADGTLSCVASDHSPCREDEKSEEKGVFSAWGGISGIQSLVQAFYSGARQRGYDEVMVASRLSEGPAKVFRLWGQKGAILPGFDADLFLLDPEESWTIRAEDLLYLNQLSAFVGLCGKGAVKTTIRRGQVVWDGEKIVSPSGGQLVTPVLSKN